MTKKLDNDKHSVEQWVDEYGDELYSWALHKTSSVETAEDLVQETFLSAFRNFDSFREKSRPKTWLISILKNKIIDHYRKAVNNYVSLDSEDVQSGRQIAESQFDKYGQWTPNNMGSYWEEDKHLLDDPEFLKILDICMQDLPAKWLIAVNFTYFSGISSRDICQELNVRPSNYWQIIHRSKLLLKKCIEKHWLS